MLFLDRTSCTAYRGCLRRLLLMVPWTLKTRKELPFFFNWCIIALPCSISFCSTVDWISYMYTYIPSILDLPSTAPRPHPTSLGHHRALSWVPWAIQKVPTTFYTWWCIYGASLVAQMVKNRLQCRRPSFKPWVGKIPWRRERHPLQILAWRIPWT